jgi:hypothetical protein
MENDITPTKTYLSVFCSESICIECGKDVSNADTRRRLFNGTSKYLACANLERVAGVIICKESCLSSIVCRSCSEKNARLISKLDAVREQFNLTTERLAEKQSESVTKRERKKETSESSDASKNPVKRRVVFAQEDPISQTNEQTTQTDAVQVSDEFSSVKVCH